MENFNNIFWTILIVVGVIAVFASISSKKRDSNSKSNKGWGDKKEKTYKQPNYQQNDNYQTPRYQQTDSVVSEEKTPLEEIKKRIKLLETARLSKKETSMNPQEIKIYRKLIAKLKDNCIVCPQVAVPSFIRNKIKKDFRIYASLYVDFLICERKSNEPICVIEFQGSGHYGEDREYTEARDILKRKLFEKVRIDLIEILGADIYSYNNNKEYIDEAKLDRELEIVKKKN
ncbi:hypothetical protein BA184_08415 [Helicobacter pullorum]|uniref:DUF2726 domain-containing protein n=1 Tax=Helicobacter pullorum TaxID=35818 RepID=UPI00081697BA|nr:DUF2726 domain-containing protein [Helicobacter pullorum]OCR03317.1 hypothetical protein BA729_07370 [Helicobacter pullorum]OCR08628.1 hypothetical protein BA184_08415 [Helicobacter pullorum]OCR10923.1 hypothetical protein BA730_07840 [Helicobacter pullorum]